MVQMRVYQGADRSTFQALTTVATGIRRFDTPANATGFLNETLQWWRENSADIDWQMPRGEIPADTLKRLRVMRDAVQGLLDGDRKGYERRLRQLAKYYSFTLQVPGGGLKPVDSGWEGFVAGLVLPLAELGERTDRLRRCGNEECFWVFLDFSRNGTRTWCHTNVCGNKMRVRRYRKKEQLAAKRARRRSGPR
jgi:predicted RNA-binding Zn ribbon-like protein